MVMPLLTDSGDHDVNGSTLRSICHNIFEVVSVLIVIINSAAIWKGSNYHYQYRSNWTARCVFRSIISRCLIRYPSVFFLFCFSPFLLCHTTPASPFGKKWLCTGAPEVIIRRMLIVSTAFVPEFSDMAFEVSDVLDFLSALYERTGKYSRRWNVVVHTFVWKAFVVRSLWEGASYGRRMCESSCMWKVLLGRRMLVVTCGKVLVERRRQSNPNL